MNLPRLFPLRPLPTARLTAHLADPPPIDLAFCPACGDHADVYRMTVDGLVCKACWKTARATF